MSSNKYNSLQDLDNYDTDINTNMFDTPSATDGMDYTIDMDAVSGNMDTGKATTSSSSKNNAMGSNKQSIQDTLDEPVLDTLVNKWLINQELIQINWWRR